MIISEKLFNIMSEKGLTQKELSDMTGISQSTISDWKHKKTNPAADKIMLICEALNISVYELLEEQGDKDKKADYIVVSKDSSEYVLLECFRGMDRAARERLIRYVEALNSK